MSILLRLVFFSIRATFNWRRECNQTKAAEKGNKTAEEASEASDKANGSVEHVENDQWFVFY